MTYVESRLAELLSSLDPELVDDRFVFVNVPEGHYGDYDSMEPIASFMENEGLTLVIRQESADQVGMPYDSAFRKITLRVPSGLLDVGLTAAVATKLTQRNIAANVIAAYHHDHLFVPADRADEAIDALRELMASG